MAPAAIYPKNRKVINGLEFCSLLIIGLPIVAFGTPTPELAVSVQAALRGSADVAVGNVVGSNIFNVLFILGVSAIIPLLIVNSQLLRLDVPLMVVVSFLMLFFSLITIPLQAGARALAGIMLWFILPVSLATMTVEALREWRSRR